MGGWSKSNEWMDGWNEEGKLKERLKSEKMNEERRQQT